MVIFYGLITLCWIAFAIYWLASATDTKPVVHVKTSTVGIRVLIVLIIVLFFRSKIFGTFGWYYIFQKSHLYVPSIGLVICVVGMLLAVWARIYLGRNWGMPQSVKKDPELVTSGPYHYMRHPIYTGILLAFFGSSIIGGLPWLLITCACAFYFIYSAHMEEKAMMKEFPKEYTTYKKHSKMFIPFVV